MTAASRSGCSDVGVGLSGSEHVHGRCPKSQHCQSRKATVTSRGTANAARFDSLRLRLALRTQAVDRRYQRGQPRDRDYDVKAREEPSLRRGERHIAVAHGGGGYKAVVERRTEVEVRDEHGEDARTRKLYEPTSQYDRGTFCPAAYVPKPACPTRCSEACRRALGPCTMGQQAACGYGPPGRSAECETRSRA